MRISVCEFLRLETRQNWCYIRPDLWSNSDNSIHAIQRGDDEFHLVYSHSGHAIRVLRYFAGKPHQQVREERAKIIKKKSGRRHA